jgi:hypothetical protein
MDADAHGRGVLAWSGLRGNTFVAQTTDVRDGRRVAPIRTLWKTTANVAIEDVDVAPSGAAAICFRERPHQDRDGAWRVRVVVRAPAGTWSSPRLVAAPGRYLEGVDCGVDEAGNVVIAWSEGISPGRLRASAVTASGLVERPTTLGRDPEEPFVEMTPSGTGLVGFASGTPETRRLLVAEKPPGSGWSSSVRTPADDGPVQGPLFAAGGDAVRALAWNGGEDDFGVRVALGPAFPLTPQSVASQDGPAVRGLAASDRGDVLVAYATSAWSPGPDNASKLSARLQRPGVPLAPPTTLGSFGAYPVAARVAADGTGAIAWVAGSDQRPRPVVRVLRADGTWGRTHQLARTGTPTGLTFGIAAAPGATSTVAWTTDPLRSGTVTLRIARVSG